MLWFAFIALPFVPPLFFSRGIHLFIAFATLGLVIPAVALLCRERPENAAVYWYLGACAAANLNLLYAAVKSRKRKALRINVLLSNLPVLFLLLSLSCSPEPPRPGGTLGIYIALWIYVIISVTMPFICMSLVGPPESNSDRNVNADTPPRIKTGAVVTLSPKWHSNSFSFLTGLVVYVLFMILLWATDCNPFLEVAAQSIDAPPQPSFYLLNILWWTLAGPFFPIFWPLAGGVLGIGVKNLLLLLFQKPSPKPPREKAATMPLFWRLQLRGIIGFTLVCLLAPVVNVLFFLTICLMDRATGLSERYIPAGWAIVLFFASAVLSGSLYGLLAFKKETKSS